MNSAIGKTILLLVTMVQTLNAVSADRFAVQNSARIALEQKSGPSGPYVIGNDANRSENEARVRDFLWSHWRQHRAGRLAVTWISKEGVSSNTTFVLENDEHGIWNIRVAIDRPTFTDPRQRHVEYRVYAVVRVEKPGDNWQGSYVGIPDDAVAPGNTFLLLLKDANGKKKATI